MPDRSTSLRHPQTTARDAACWIGGLVALCVVFAVLDRRILNVVTYALLPVDDAGGWTAWWPPTVVVAAVAVLAAQRRRPICAGAVPTLARIPAGRSAIPLLPTVLVGAGWLTVLHPTYPTACLALVGAAWAVDRLGREVPLPGERRLHRPTAAVVLALAIAVSIAWHAGEQVRLWRCFMLGYADFGRFTTELEHCLPWKGVGADRFGDPLMAHHCVPMFYGLAPLYAVFRSPMFLMFVGPAVLAVAAVPFYHLARAGGLSRLAALVVGLAWLALPSVTRMPYSGSYGFQAPYLAVPWLAWSLASGLSGRWKRSHVCLAAAMLCQETVCGVALGWGLYLALVGGRRRAGLTIVAASVAYVGVCVTLIVPGFAGAAGYDRLELFGNATWTGLLARVGRPRVGFYLLALSAPLLPVMLRGGSLLIVAVPTLLLVILLANPDYLNIKYWHQSSVLPVLFAAAVVGVSRPHGAVAPGPETRPPQEKRAGGAALTLLVGVLLLQQLMGVSPLSHPYRYARNAPVPPPRHQQAAVEYVRAQYPPSRTCVLATERLAAHFTDFRMTYPAGDPRVRGLLSRVDLLVLDREDRWDRMVGEGKLPALIAEARAAGFHEVHSGGPVVILAAEQRQGD